MNDIVRLEFDPEGYFKKGFIDDFPSVVVADNVDQYGFHYHETARRTSLLFLETYEPEEWNRQCSFCGCYIDDHPDANSFCSSDCYEDFCTKKFWEQ